MSLVPRPTAPNRNTDESRSKSLLAHVFFFYFKVNSRLCAMLTVRASLGGVVDTPLFQAAFNGKVAVAKELLAKGAAPNQGSLIQFR